MIIIMIDLIKNLKEISMLCKFAFNILALLKKLKYLNAAIAYL